MSWIMIEYLCPTCGQRFESLEDRAAPSAQLPHCEAQAARVLSAVRGRVKIGEVRRGKNEERPPGVLNTEPLADGQPYADWRNGLKAGRMDELREGVIDRQVYV